MNDRYFAKVVSITDEFTIVISAGSEQGIREHQRFLIVGLGPMVVDPDTGVELEALEVVRGRAETEHVQSRIATLRSIDAISTPDSREVTRVSSKGVAVLSSFMGGGPQETVTEIVKPGISKTRPFKGIKIGDFAIKL